MLGRDVASGATTERSPLSLTSAAVLPERTVADRTRTGAHSATPSCEAVRERPFAGADLRDAAFGCRAWCRSRRGCSFPRSDRPCRASGPWRSPARSIAGPCSRNATRGAVCARQGDRSQPVRRRASGRATSISYEARFPDPVSDRWDWSSRCARSVPSRR